MHQAPGSTRERRRSGRELALAVFFQADADAVSGGDAGGYIGAGAGDGWVVDGDRGELVEL